MRRSQISALLAALLTFLLAGCTPLSEQRIHRSSLGGTSPQFPSEQVLPLTPAEQRLEGRLDGRTLYVLHRYGSAIHACAERYDLDWRFLLAVMKTESSFRPSAQSERGAYGLMQIMPVTGAELARKLDLTDVRDPFNNIPAGAYYLHRLNRLFAGAPLSDRLRLTLAAYNAGPGRVFDAQELALFFHGNPSRWSTVRRSLAMLGSDRCELHAIIWDDGKPRSGWFDNCQETLVYVDRVMAAYAHYKKVAG